MTTTFARGMMRAMGCSIGRWCVATGVKICSCTSCSNNVHARRVRIKCARHLSHTGKGNCESNRREYYTLCRYCKLRAIYQNLQRRATITANRHFWVGFSKRGHSTGPTRPTETQNSYIIRATSTVRMLFPDAAGEPFTFISFS